MTGFEKAGKTTTVNALLGMILGFSDPLKATVAPVGKDFVVSLSQTFFIHKKGSKGKAQNVPDEVFPMICPKKDQGVGRLLAFIERERERGRGQKEKEDRKRDGGTGS